MKTKNPKITLILSAFWLALMRPWLDGLSAHLLLLTAHGLLLTAHCSRLTAYCSLHGNHTSKTVSSSGVLHKISPPEGVTLTGHSERMPATSGTFVTIAIHRVNRTTPPHPLSPAR